jgi:hypothetical protein
MDIIGAPAKPLRYCCYIKQLTCGCCCSSQVQYPNALRTMEMDLSNIRLAAQYLSKTVSHAILVLAVFFKAEHPTQ